MRDRIENWASNGTSREYMEFEAYHDGRGELAEVRRRMRRKRLPVCYGSQQKPPEEEKTDGRLEHGDNSRGPDQEGA